MFLKKCAVKVDLVFRSFLYRLKRKFLYNVHLQKKCRKLLKTHFKDVPKRGMNLFN